MAPLVAPTDLEKSRLRRQLGHDADSLPDGEILELYEEAEGLYPGYSRAVLFAAVRLQGRLDLLTAAAKDVTYKKNETSENRSDMFKALEKLVAQDKAALATLMHEESPKLAVAFGLTKKIPTRITEWPDA